MKTIVIAIFMIIIWWIPVIRDRQNGNLILLSSRTFIALGFTLMFALPSIYFAIVPWDFTAEDFTPYYAETLFMPIIAGIPFLFQALLWRLKIPTNIANSNKYDPIMNSNKLPGWFVILVASFFICGIFAKYFQITTGSFYHLNRTFYQFDNYDIFVLITFFSDYFVIAGLLLLFVGFKKKKLRYLWTGYCIIAIELVLSIMSGRRLLVLQLIIQLFVLKMSSGWRLNTRTIVILVAIVIFVIPVLGRYSTLLYDQAPTKITTIANMRMRLSTAYQEKSFKKKIDEVVSRLGDIRGPAAVYSCIPETIEYQYGKTYRHLLWFFIPRIVWHDKPDPREIAEYTRIAIPHDAGSSPLSWVGESYLNFSWYGVFMIGCLMAFITRRLDRWFLPRIQTNVLWAVLWATLSFRLVWVGGQEFMDLFNEFLRMFIMMYLIDGFLYHGRLKRIIKFA
ncbi:MAG: hypothetical protein JYX80_02930 [Candidatus Scalindua sediminis]|nr:hypothetical protein [Candidatus Scalindua sediminis]